MALLARWRADQLVFEDTGGTNAAEDTDGVASWGAYEGSQAGALAVQATGGNRPTYNASDGGYPSVSVVGASSQRLTLAHSAPWVLTAFSWLAAIKMTSAQYRHIWGRGSAWTNAGCFLDGFTANMEFRCLYFHTGYLTRFSSLPKPDSTSTTWFVAAGIADANKIEVYVNRQSVARVSQSNTVDFSTNPLTLFADGGGSASYNMTGAAREFAFWDSALTGAEMQDEIDTVMDRWEITDTVTPPTSGTARPAHPMKSQVIG